MSNFPLSHLPLSHRFSAGTWLQYLRVPPFLGTPSCMHLVSISKFPPPSSGIHFRVPKIPPASLSIFCVYLNVSSFRFNVSASPLIYQQLFALILFQYRAFPFPYVPVNFLHPFRFIRRLPPLASPPLLTFLCFNTGTSPASTTSCMHLVSVSKFPSPCARSKKTCAGSNKEGAKVQKHPAQCERL